METQSHILHQQLLSTFFSGLYISKKDLIDVGKAMGIDFVLIERETMLKRLLKESDTDAITTLLHALIDQKIAQYRELEQAYPESKAIIESWVTKAGATKTLITRSLR